MKTSLPTILAIFIFTIIFSPVTPSPSKKCQSNSNMRYDLNHTSELKGYHSLCSQFSKRTCCSGKNFQALAKKITTKLLGTDHQSLSLNCRRKLTMLLCSTCDGDIGQKSVDGVCPQVCHNVYEACKNDFFSIDSLNKMKVCRDDDIICSKLTDIFPQPQKSSLFCQMFGIETAQHDCWNGIPSFQTKGIPKKKVNYHSSHHKQKPSNNWSLLQRLLRVDKKYWIYIGLVCLLLTILAYKWLSIKLQNQSRRIKNL